MSELPKSAARKTRQRVLKSNHFALSWRRRADVSGEFTDSDRLMMAVPKKLLKRAVDRNAVRRVAREVWRHRCVEGPVLSRPLLRLTARPVHSGELSRPQRKRLWRSELDGLIARVVKERIGA